MNSKAPSQRLLAVRGIDEALEYYLGIDATAAALGFVASLQTAYTHIGKHPATGLPRYAHELDLPGLRSWPLSKYPYLVFYVEHANRIDVWRVLHMKRDIPAWMMGDQASQ